MRERRNLQYPAGTVVVLGVTLLNAVGISRHPPDILGEPLLHGRKLRGSQKGRSSQSLDCARNFDEVQSIDYSGSPSGSNAMNGLGIFQVRIHASPLIYEPGAQV